MDVLQSGRAGLRPLQFVSNTCQLFDNLLLQFKLPVETSVTIGVLPMNSDPFSLKDLA